MTTHEVVSKSDWVEARKRLLASEKDLVPKGRDEAGLLHTMAWVKLRDRHER